MMIDSHFHTWQRKEGLYSWLTPEHGPLFDDFPAAGAGSEIGSAGVHGAVLVQADDSFEDTTYLLEAAEEYDWALGVVAWLPLDSPDQAAGLLKNYSEQSTVCGVRQLVHDDPRNHFYEMDEVREVAEMLVEHSLPLDIPDAWPRDLPQVVDLAARHPGLTVVLDHLGKPPVERAALGEWLTVMTAFSENPNTVVKFSGLHHPERPFTVEGVLPLWEVCLQLFGPRRMMVGSDWPVSVGYGGYLPTWQIIQKLLSRVSFDERVAIEVDTACRVYGRSEKVAAVRRKEDH